MSALMSALPGREFQLIGYLRLFAERQVESAVHRTRFGVIDVLMDLPESAPSTLFGAVPDATSGKAMSSS
jgi:hypothetical protein